MNKRSKKEVDIGLDIGIASVGWAITDIKTLDIEEYGVRLFSTVDDAKDSKLKNEERREARSLRRQVNRRRTLKRDFIKFLISQKYVTDIKFDLKGHFVKAFLDKYINNAKLQKQWKKTSENIPYTFYLRRKALEQRVSKNDLIAVLYWYINHRGFKYENADEEKEKPDEDTLKKKDSSKLPVENQIQYLKNNGYLNGAFNRTFHQKEYLDEIKQIFTHQNSEAQKIKAGFIKFFTRQRSFEQGPGDEKTKTKYGRFYNLEKIYDQKGKFSYVLKKVDKDKVPKSIWENTVGKCTFYPDQFRAPKKSFTAEIFNLLNELGNIEIEQTGEVLTKDHKIEIIKTALQERATNKSILKKVYQLFDLDPKDAAVEGSIKGLPKDKSDKYFLTEIKSVKQLRKILPAQFCSFEYLFNNITIGKDNSIKINEDNIIDKIFEIFSKSKTIEKREELLQEKIFEFIKDKDLISKIAKTKLERVSNTHSLSFKAMRKMIPDFIIEPKSNQMIWARKKGINFNKGINYGTNYLISDWVEDIITTPTVKRAFRQTTKVLNAIFKLAYDRKLKIRTIVIEMAREAKNKEAKEQEKNRQKYFENKNKQIQTFLDKESKRLKLKKISNYTQEKIWLLEQQKGYDAYTGEKINMEEVINKPGNFDVDHIIPYSQSYSNNRSNRVLTRQSINQQKGNLSSFQYFKKENFKNYEKMKKLWKNWYCQKFEKDRKVYMDFDKYDFLTSEIDYSIPQNQLGFIQRNLVDTRYITKTIMEALINFAKSDKNDFDFKVKAINGKMTAFARNRIAVKYENGIEIERLQRPDNLPLFDEKEIMIQGKPKIIKSKSRIWNGHHAEDAYILTVLNSHFNDSKIIEKILSSPQKFSRFQDHYKKNQENWIENKFDVLMKKLDQARQKLNNKMENIRFSRMIKKRRNTKLFNETLYKGQKNVDGNINKFEHKELCSKDFQVHKFFGKNSRQEDKEKLMIYKYNKPLYKKLDSIYENYYTNDKTNPFVEASQDQVGQKNINNAFQVKKLWLLSQSGQKAKNPLHIVTAKDNKNSFYESLNWVAINIYKDNKGRYKIISVDASNHKFKTLENDKVKWIIKKDVLNKQLKDKNIEDEKPVATLFYGDTLILPNNKRFVYVCGRNQSSNKLELKFLFKQKSEKRNFMAINKMIGAKLVKFNILGINFREKFKF